MNGVVDYGAMRFVVFCKNCRFAKPPAIMTAKHDPNARVCKNFHSFANHRTVKGNDFCTYGEMEVTP